MQMLHSNRRQTGGPHEQLQPALQNPQVELPSERASHVNDWPNCTLQGLVEQAETKQNLCLYCLLLITKTTTHISLIPPGYTETKAKHSKEQASGMLKSPAVGPSRETKLPNLGLWKGMEIS